MPKKKLQGVVVSDKNDKTIVVLAERKILHPKLKKTITVKKRYHAHDENNLKKIGDKVTIQENKPISKLKKWVVCEGDAK